MISVGVKGDSRKTTRDLDKMRRQVILASINSYGQMGVDALARATPVESSATRNAWKYRTVKTRTGFAIEWYNTNDGGDVSVAVLIQYGHGTGTGGYVYGRDFINPAMRPVFDTIADDVWKKVKS